MIHWAVRWKSVSSSTSSTRAETIWIADEPVPTTPTRLPVRAEHRDSSARCGRPRPRRSPGRRCRGRRGGGGRPSRRSRSRLVGRSVGHLDLPAAILERAAGDLLAELDPASSRRSGARRPRSRPGSRLPARSDGSTRGSGRRSSCRNARGRRRRCRVGILAPRPAEAVGFLVDREVVEAGLLQLDRSRWGSDAYPSSCLPGSGRLGRESLPSRSEIDHVDLYSCFPSSVQVAAA